MILLWFFYDFGKMASTSRLCSGVVGEVCTNCCGYCCSTCPDCHDWTDEKWEKVKCSSWRIRYSLWGEEEERKAKPFSSSFSGFLPPLFCLSLYLRFRLAHFYNAVIMANTSSNVCTATFVRYWLCLLHWQSLTFLLNLFQIQVSRAGREEGTFWFFVRSFLWWDLGGVQGWGFTVFDF